MEQFDVLDIHGNPSGLTKPKGAPLTDGQYYLGVHVYIHNATGQFLLQRRALDKPFLPGGWDTLLEHVIAGETSVQAAARGVDEELGLSVAESQLRFAERFIWESFHHLVDVYFLQMEFDPAELRLQATEVIAAKLVCRKEMLRFVANMHYRPAEYRALLTSAIEHLSL